jgi:hypothetical protein
LRQRPSDTAPVQTEQPSPVRLSYLLECDVIGSDFTDSYESYAEGSTFAPPHERSRIDFCLESAAQSDQ